METFSTENFPDITRLILICQIVKIPSNREQELGPMTSEFNFSCFLPVGKNKDKTQRAYVYFELRY